MFETEQPWVRKILKTQEYLQRLFHISFFMLVLVLMTRIIPPYQNVSKDSLRIEHWAVCIRLGMQTWTASQVEPVPVEPGVRKQDIPPLSKLDVVFASFLSHLRGGPIWWLHMFPLKLIGCF